MNKLVWVLAAFLAGITNPVAAAAGADVVVHVYGPGGPGPAMQEAATEFGEMHRITVIVTTGPTSLWAFQVCSIWPRLSRLSLDPQR